MDTRPAGQGPARRRPAGRRSARPPRHRPRPGGGGGRSHLGSRRAWQLIVPRHSTPRPRPLQPHTGRDRWPSTSSSTLAIALRPLHASLVILPTLNATSRPITLPYFYFRVLLLTHSYCSSAYTAHQDPIINTAASTMRSGCC